MKTLRPNNSSLMLSIILWGTLLGGITYSHMVYFPAYLSALPDSAVVVNGPYGLREAIFWMTIHPLLILSLIVTIVLNWRLKARRKLILISFSIYLLVLVVTQIYFLPELIAFEGSPQSGLPPAEWLARSQRWQRLSMMRGVVMYAGILPLLLALANPAGAPGDSVAAAG